jgi:hypothetical protein
MDGEVRKDLAVEMAVGGGMAAVGAVVGGPVAAGLLQAGTPAISDLIRTIMNRAGRQRVEQAERALQEASAVAEVDLQELVVQLLGDRRTAALLAAALEGASRSIAEEKIAIFGRSIANAFIAQEDAIVDTEAFFVEAFSDLEMPHIRVLLLLAADTERSSAGRALSIDEISRESGPKVCPAIRPIIATLERLGLIATWREFSQGDYPPLARSGTRSSSIEVPRWSVTTFGRRCIDRLTDSKVRSTGLSQ